MMLHISNSEAVLLMCMTIISTSSNQQQQSGFHPKNTWFIWQTKNNYTWFTCMSMKDGEARSICGLLSPSFTRVRYKQPGWKKRSDIRGLQKTLSIVHGSCNKELNQIEDLFNTFYDRKLETLPYRIETVIKQC